MIININKEIKNIKFPKIIFHNNYYLIYGIKTIKIDDELNRFIIICFKYDKNFNFMKENIILPNNEKSLLIWDIRKDTDYYIFLIEQKSIDRKNHTCSFFNYYINNNDIEIFKINKIEKIPLTNHLIFHYNYKSSITLSSKISIDEENPNYYWGKYLFFFYKNGKSYQPLFDKYVDYKNDKGHLLHHIEKKDDYYICIFSIRNKINNNKYKYNLYCSKTGDFVNFYDTNNIEINNNLTKSNWYCYPTIIKNNNTNYILINQDDFGKKKKTLVGTIKI